MEKSGLYLTSRTGLSIFLGLETVLGKSGLIAMLRYSKLTQFIDNYPPNTMERTCDFADTSSLHAALEDLYGGRGGKVLMMHVGREIWNEQIGPLANPNAIAPILSIKNLPEEQRIGALMKVMKSVYEMTADRQIVVEETEEAYLFKSNPCPCCWGRKMVQPGCHVTAGHLQGAILWACNQIHNIVQTTCIGCGDEVCTYKIMKAADTNK